MPSDINAIPRRAFSRALAVAGLSAAISAKASTTVDAKVPLKLGIDNFALRALKWNERQLVDYAVKLNVDVLFITDFYAFTSLDDRHLKDTRKYAADKKVDIYLGNSFDSGFFAESTVGRSLNSYLSPPNSRRWSAVVSH